jgi:hypothetical protein
MTYTPKPDREVKDGKAVVSAKELAAFKSQYGEDKSLRDLLNMDKGFRRKGEGSAPAPAPAIKVPSKTEAAALEAKGLANQKAHQDEEEKAEANAGKAAVEEKVENKPYRSKNITDLFGLSSNIKKPTDAPTPKETSKPNLGEQGRKSEENERMIKGVASNVGTAIMDYANKPYVSPAARKADENKGKTYRDLNGNIKTGTGMKHGGAVKKMASSGMASSRGDGIAQRGKTRGKMC